MFARGANGPLGRNTLLLSSRAREASRCRLHRRCGVVIWCRGKCGPDVRWRRVVTDRGWPGGVPRGRCGLGRLHVMSALRNAILCCLLKPDSKYMGTTNLVPQRIQRGRHHNLVTRRARSRLRTARALCSMPFPMEYVRIRR